METPPIRFTMNLEAADSALLSEAQAKLHRETGRAHSRAEAFRAMLRQYVAPETDGQATKS